jgi:hypothetical protein
VPGREYIGAGDGEWEKGGCEVQVVEFSSDVQGLVKSKEQAVIDQFPSGFFEDGSVPVDRRQGPSQSRSSDQDPLVSHRCGRDSYMGIDKPLLIIKCLYPVVKDRRVI